MIIQISLYVSGITSKPAFSVVLTAIALIGFVSMSAVAPTIETRHQTWAATGIDSARQLISSPVSEIPLASGAEPLGLTIGPLGNVWFAENNSTSIVEYFPTNQSSRSYPIPTSGTSLIWFLIFDPSGNLWFSNQLEPYLWRFSTTTDQFENFTTGAQNTDPFGLAFDNYTNQIWFTSTYTDQIGYFDLRGQVATIGKIINESVTMTSKFGPAGILVGSNGDIYISQPFFGDVAEYDPSTQSFISSWNLQPQTQAVGIDLEKASNTLWFANDASSLFGYVDLNTSQSTAFATSFFESKGGTVSQPYWVTIAPSGAVWFDEYASNKIARYTPSTGLLTEFAIPTNQSTPLRLVIDNQREAVWFTEFSGDKLGAISENASCNCEVQLSSRNLTLSSRSVNFYLKYTLPDKRLNQNSPAPLISGSFQRDGHLTGNLSTKAVVINSSFYEITLTRGQDLNNGHYSITVCPRITTSDNSSSPTPVRQCATSQLTVEGQNLGSTSIFARWAPTAILLVAASVAFLGFYLKSRNRLEKKAIPQRNRF